MAQIPKLIFPKIKRVILESFSLYTLKPNIDVEMEEGVFCLAGANGLGKSTFLAALNFAITGIVTDPQRGFKSVFEYYKGCSKYSSEFFTGRIKEEDRDAAAVTVYLVFGSERYKITRGVFEPSELREFTIRESTTGKLIFDGSEETAEHLQLEYQHRITQAIGLESFEQFVFLHSLVLTFDEKRHLLLWDQPALNQALFLCIGANPGKAQKADQLYREMQKAASLGRNASWQASILSEEIKLLRKATGADTETAINLEETAKHYEALQNELRQLEAQYESKKNQFEDAKLHWIKTSAEISSLQVEYASEFSKYVQVRPPIEVHPIVKASLEKKECALCGSLDGTAVDSIKQKIDNKKCPLCSSNLLEQTQDVSVIEKLQEIDTVINKLKKELAFAVTAKTRIASEKDAIEDLRDEQIKLLESFEQENLELLVFCSDKNNTLSVMLRNKIAEKTKFLNRKKEKYKERDEKKIQYLKLQRDLEENYREAETNFVPIFRDLAFQFLGLELDISLNFSKSIAEPGVSLVLEVRGEVRRKIYQLSESQRFFLDIALRMALVRYCSAPSNEASLFIDTPEGSLDIAYESRAGQMFADFILSGHDIIMTANINSSQILKKLAFMCGRGKMQLHQMTSWTELSDVQIKSEDLFLDAYKAIENALDSSSNLTDA